MIRSVGRHVSYTPDTIANLFADDIDFHGIEYWYNDAIDLEKETKARIKNKK